MFYKKKGTPVIGDIVMCTVKKILPHSVFVSIDEYENREGMVHISEIAPGRIRKLRDYVIEGKTIVCKVLNINQQGNIDLSLRRVGTGIMLNKLKGYKQEEKAEKLIENIGKEFNYDLKKIYSEFGNNAIEKYGGIYNFLQNIVNNGERAIEGLNIQPKFAKKLVEVIKEKLKPSAAIVDGILSLKTYESNGINIVKKLLMDLEKEELKITYLGAPRYKIESSATDFKKATNNLDAVVNKIIESAKKLKCETSFIKSD